MSHAAYTVLMALLVSGAAALPGNRSSRERACVAGYIFAACLASVVAGGWFLYLVHG